VRGRTVTVRVQSDEGELLAERTENGRRLNQVVGDMERVSDRLTGRALRSLRSREEATTDHQRARERGEARLDEGCENPQVDRHWG